MILFSRQHFGFSKVPTGQFFSFLVKFSEVDLFFRYQVSHSFRYFGDFLIFVISISFCGSWIFFRGFFWWFLVGCYRFFGFFRLQVEFIKCWNKLKMQIIIFIPPSADSSCSTARVALLICFESSLSLFVIYFYKLFLNLNLFLYSNSTYFIDIISHLFKVSNSVVVLLNSEVRQIASSDISFTIRYWRFRVMVKKSSWIVWRSTNGDEDKLTVASKSF